MHAERQPCSLRTTMGTVSTRDLHAPSQLLMPGLDLSRSATSVADAEGSFTFRPSRRLPIHGWYPYVEGFSAPYVHAILRRFGLPNCVYDACGGSGTVMLEA